MKNLSRAFLLCFMMIALVGVAKADQLDNYVRSEIAKRRIPGLSIAVIRGGKVVRSSVFGFSNIENSVPITADSVFEIGSISKQFTAEAIMLLVEEGKLTLDTPINEYLPKNAPDAWRPVTVRNLLNQTSGIKDWTEIAGFSYRREYTAEEFVELLREFPLNFAPNADWLYSNSNAPLLGIIVERASGKPYEQFVTERIFKRFGLKSIRFKHQPDVIPNRVSGYVLRDSVMKNGEPFRPTIIAPSGGIVASSVDLAMWFDALMKGKILSSRSLEQVLTPTRIADGRTVNHGLGVFKDSFADHVAYFHHGSTAGGFGSVVRHFPKEDITIAIMGNLEDGGFGPEVISKRVADVYIPGVFVGGMKPSPDPDGAFSVRLIAGMKEIASGKDSQILKPGFSARIADDLRLKIAEIVRDGSALVHLKTEIVGADHFMLDPSITKIVHYRSNVNNRMVYVTVRIDRAGHLTGISLDE